MEYTAEHIALIQRFVDFYRSAPETLTISERFVSFPLNEEETKNIENLAKEGIIEIKESSHPGIPTFYRLSDKSFDVIAELKKEQKIVFN